MFRLQSIFMTFVKRFFKRFFMTFFTTFFTRIRLWSQMWALGLALLFAAAVAVPSARAEDFHGPYFHNGFVSGVPYGYGYVYPGAWPLDYWVNPFVNGFSFYPSYVYDYDHDYSSFAAISYSGATNIFGYAFNAQSRYDAEIEANRRCGVADCRPVVWVQGGCAVVVTSASTRRLTWAYNSTVQGAQSWAQRMCANDGSPHGVTDCVLRVWICSY
jgi:Domain of unknown function (DUF4189)